MPETLRNPAPSARPRDRSAEARKAGRVKKAERETRIVGLLNRGVSMAEIAAGERVSVNRMRKVVRGALERRMPKAPAEYVALQVNRLNEALLVSYGSMYNPETGANFEAIDSVVNIVREMDRYHGFFPASQRPERKARSLPEPAAPPPALEPRRPTRKRRGNRLKRLVSGLQMADRTASAELPFAAVPDRSSARKQGGQERTLIRGGMDVPRTGPGCVHRSRSRN